MTNENLPTTYPQFKTISNLRRHSKNKKELTRFGFRYRLAKGFVEITAKGIGKTLKGYNSILKIFLAYTAYEQLIRASVGLNVYGLLRIESNTIVDKVLADKLRKNIMLIDFLIENSNGALVKQLISFRNNTNNDIVCIGYAIRNVFAHGELTATAVGTSLKSQRDVLEELADTLLNYCDDNFTKCVEKLR